MYYRQPRYFKDFQCVGGDCPDNCCYGWIIHWNKPEVEKAKNAPGISDELKELVDKSFTVIGKNPHGYAEDSYIVEFDEQGKCPFQTLERLCRIQKELGAEYLSCTCMIYPRNCIVTKNTIRRFCNSSCPEIITKLLNQRKAMEMEYIPINEEDKVFGPRVIDKEEISRNPALEYFDDVFEFFYEVVSDNKISVETAIIFGAIAAKKLSEIIGRKEYGKIPESLKAFLRQFRSAAPLIKSIDDIKPKPQLKFAVLTLFAEKILAGNSTALLCDETGEMNIALYDKGKKRLNEMLNGRGYFVRNLVLNLLYETLALPFIHERRSLFDSYRLFIAGIGLLKLNMIAVCSTEDDITISGDGRNKFVYSGDNKLIGSTAILCRKICQSKDVSKLMIAYMNENELTIPADLAYLIK